MSLAKLKPYSKLAIQNIQERLLYAKEKALNYSFEILIDEMLMIPRTDDLGDFDEHLRFLNPEVNKLEIRIFNDLNAQSPIDIYQFQYKEQTQELNGLHQLQIQQQDQITLNKIQELESEIEEQQTCLDEQDEWIDYLEDKLQQLETEQLANQSDKDTSLLQQGLKFAKDSKLIDKLAPTVGAVMDYWTNDGVKKQAPIKDASFEIKSDAEGEINVNAARPNKASFNAPFNGSSSDSQNDSQSVSMNGFAQNQITESDLFFIEFGKKLSHSLSQQDLEVALDILNQFCHDTSQIKPVADLLNIKVKK